MDNAYLVVLRDIGNKFYSQMYEVMTPDLLVFHF